MLLLILIAILVYTNFRLAKKKGKNPFVWGLLSLLAFFLTFFLFSVIYLRSVYKGAQTREALTAHFNHEPLTAIMLAMLGVGGVLIIRYILERSKGSDAV